ncbi:alpha/beta hydrolase family protein [Micromonospora rosaria]|uniref:alpha/beta hydrolase family protein n=1 Tax=Micromonospora rosaria TaxID=47874 RepID=UPI000A6D7BF1|nr:alpha/beta fold hydrolase [Micromonospora rosaria]
MSAARRGPARFGVHLAADASWAATSRLDGDAVTVELWDRDGATFTPHPTPLAVEPVDQLVPTAGRRLLICGGGGSRHTVWTVDCATLTRTRLTTRAGQAVRLLTPAPGDPDRRPWVLAYDGTRTTLARLVTHGPTPTAVIALPGAYTGGVWTDRAGRRLGLGRSRSGEPHTAVEVDLVTGADRTLFEVSDHSNDTLQAWHPGTGLGVVHTDVGGVQRLGYARPGRGERWAFPDDLAAPDGLVEAVAVDPDGHRILAHERRGVRSLLHRYDVVRHRRDTLVVPPGALAGRPVWTRRRLVVPWTTPRVPLTFLDLGPAGDRPADADATPDPGWEARVVTVPGAAGPIEAIAYGGDRWWQRPRVVVALHGGPSSAWQLAYHPFFAQLAAEGVAVLALNPRGSVGYGHAFAAAIRTGWGGPDLDDVLAVGRHLRALRGDGPGVALVGSSYGGFLALLAAAAGPQLWGRCAAVAPFSSAARLHRQAEPTVRRMIERLGGLTDPPHAGLGPRDLLRLGHRTRAPILLLHGRHDEQIPVGHVRELAAALVAARGPAVRYREYDLGHDVDGPTAWDAIADFLREPHHDPVVREQGRLDHADA